MESVKTLLLICILFAYPFALGSLWGFRAKAKGDKMTAGKMYIFGCLIYGALFGMLSFFVSFFSWFFGRLEKLSMLMSAALFAGWCLVLICVRKYRIFLKELLENLVSGWSGWDTVCVAAYVAVAVVYLSHPFYISDSFSVPEQVLMLLQNGQMEAVQDRPALLYACLCDWFGLDVYAVLMRAIPYAMLLLVFCVMAELATVCFGEKKHARAGLLAVYAALILFGNEAYMNPPYGLLHYPYEGMTFLSNVCIPLILVVFAAKDKHMRLLFLPVLINAAAAVGVAKSGMLLGAEILLLAIVSVIFLLVERRKAG